MEKQGDGAKIDMVEIRHAPDDGLEDLVRRGIDGLCDLSSETANAAGWYNDPETGERVERNVGEVLMLMVTELAEGFQAWRRDLMDDKLPHRKGIEVEFADAFLRISDTAKALGLDLSGAVIEKNRFNKVRPDHKLEARQGAHGKKC